MRRAQRRRASTQGSSSAMGGPEWRNGIFARRSERVEYRRACDRMDSQASGRQRVGWLRLAARRNRHVIGGTPFPDGLGPTKGLGVACLESSGTLPAAGRGQRRPSPSTCGLHEKP